MEIHQLKVLAAAASDVVAPLPEKCENVVQPCDMMREEEIRLQSSSETETVLNPCNSMTETDGEIVRDEDEYRFSLTTVCGRRRDMEDVVAIKPSFCGDLHF
ncbi:hypothetical protein L1887_34985 [Cichorium endivia]|nr:hypothetical protein L1887_34985 [Cichorium endivia]